MAEGTVAEPTYIGRVVEAIKQNLQGSEVAYEQLRADRYRFIVVWPKFDDMDFPERQHLVWDIVQRAVDPEDIMKVSMVLTLGAEDLPTP